MIKGFSVHAGVSVPARDRLRLERLLRYASRGPISNERLSLLPDGRIRYKLKRRWKDGTKAVIYEPMELMERLAALTPPPRFNRFYSSINRGQSGFKPEDSFQKAARSMELATGQRGFARHGMPQPYPDAP
jgi:hypothetical protein